MAVTGARQHRVSLVSRERGSGLALLAAGAILAFAFSVRPGFLDLRVAGLILIARAAAGTWLSASPAGRARWSRGLRLVAARGAEAIEPGGALDPQAGQPGRSRVPLDHLLATRPAGGDPR